MATRAEPDRDQYGRYKLPEPETKELKAWTRATTIASTLGNTWALEAWKMRQVARGIARYPSLRAKLVGIDPMQATLAPHEKKLLNEVCQEAMDRVGSSDKADVGTSIHAMCEQLDLGEREIADYPEEFHGDLVAYTGGLAAHEVTILPDWVERIVINPEIGSAGTLDRIVAYGGGTYIADIKTGSLDFSLLDISIQLSIYANAVGAWTGEGYEPLPDVSKTDALVLHLPAGKANFSLWVIDIAYGWEQAKLSRDVRLIQKEKPGFKIELEGAKV